MKKSAATIKGVGGLVVVELMGLPAPLKVVGKLSDAQYMDCFTRAAAQLGFKRSARAKSGWVK